MKTKELLKLIYETKGYHTGMIDAMVDFEGINLVLSKSELEKLASRLIEVEVDKRGGGMMHDRKLEDLVNHPDHYNQGGIETLDIIKMSLTKEEYKGYLKGNVLKYRERAQFKGNAEQDYAKAKFYFEELGGLQ